MSVSGLRKAALYLHGLSGKDRKWLLSHFSDPEQIELNRLLKELEGLGLPREEWTSMLDEVEPGSLARDRAPAEYEKELAAAHPDVLWEVLKDEPDIVTEALLSIREWAWASHVSKLFLRKRGRQPGFNLALSNKAAQTLLCAVAEELKKVRAGAGKERLGFIERVRRLRWRR